MLKTFDITLDLENPALVDAKISISQADVNTSEFNVYITQDGAVVNLTGLTASFVSQSPTGITAKADMTIEDALAGKLGYSLLTNNISEAGYYMAEIMLTDASGNVAVTQQFSYTVRTALINTNTVEALNEVQDYHQNTFNRLAGVNN